jgi:hypothetical protein
MAAVANATAAAVVAAVTLLVMCVREGGSMLDGPAAISDGRVHGRVLQYFY